MNLLWKNQCCLMRIKRSVINSGKKSIIVLKKKLILRESMFTSRKVTNKFHRIVQISIKEPCSKFWLRSKTKSLLVARLWSITSRMNYIHTMLVRKKRQQILESGN